MNRNTKQRQEGQAIVEAGLLIPLLVFMLVAVGFLGFAIYERQNVLIAARFAAREASMNALASAASKLTGAGLVQVNTPEARAGYARMVLGSKRHVTASTPAWRYEHAVSHKNLLPVPVGTLARAYVAKKGKFGIGFIMYGQRLSSKGNWLDALGSGANESSKLVSDRPSKIWDGVGVKAEAYMPGELPIHAPGIGLLELNSWIKDDLAGE